MPAFRRRLLVVWLPARVVGAAERAVGLLRAPVRRRHAELSGHARDAQVRRLELLPVDELVVVRVDRLEKARGLGAAHLAREKRSRTELHRVMPQGQEVAARLFRHSERREVPLQLPPRDRAVL